MIIYILQIDLTVENRAIKDFLLAQKEIHLKSELPNRRSLSPNDGCGLDEAQNSVESKQANDCPVVNNSPSRTYSTPPKYQAVLQPSYMNGISSPLQPVPVGSNSFDSPSSMNVSSSPTHNKLKNNLLKLEDFEVCQSSPFDAVELKTLNVFEELRQVLQGHHANGHQSVVVTDQQTQSTPSSINGHRHFVHNLQ